MHTPARFIRVKPMILLCCSLYLIGTYLFDQYSLDIIVHYLFLSGFAVVFSFIFLESMRFFCFFLVCYYFCLKTVNVLLRRKTWLFLLKIFLIININWVVVALVLIELQSGFIENYQDYNLCFEPIFLVLRSGGEIVTIVFAIIGVVITRSVYKFQKTQIFIKPE